MGVTAAEVKELREKTGAGMMDSKKALTEANGDMEKAGELLREKGLAKAAKKASRLASEGIVDSYIHMGGTVGVLLEVNSETDFVAKTPAFKEFVHDVALHIAASNPLYVTREEVDQNLIEKEREILTAQVKNEGKPDNIIGKIVDGKIEKYYKEIVLMEQPFVKNPDQSIEDLVKEQIASLGENIQIRRFTRYEMGEGLEKKGCDFATEVAEQMGK